MKQKPFTISVPDPCNQNWDEMTPMGNGRHCDHCQKTVIDFTRFSDAALHKFFTTNGPACGRFLATQVNRNLNIPPQPNSKLYRLAIACGLTLLFAPTASKSYGQNNVRSAAQNPITKADSTNWSLSPISKITGKVMADGNNPMPNATVTAIRDGKIMGTAITDAIGRYEIFPLTTGVYDVKVILDNSNLTNFREGIQVGNDSSAICDLQCKPIITVTISDPNFLNYHPEIMGTSMPMQPIDRLIISTNPTGWIYTVKKKKKRKHSRH